MKVRTGIVAAAIGVASAAAGAAPARAADSCHEPERIVYCLCVAAATALSPVIPPESWDCNPS
jgi:hypothetical protein